MAKAISKGNLDTPLPPADNEIAASIKDLHAALKHLTWQTQQVAKGDYQQRVDFMGDFTEAFNAMVEQLEQQRSALLKEIESRRIENEVLLQNKSLYELLIGQIMQWTIVVDADTAEWMFVSREIECIFTNPACDCGIYGFQFYKNLSSFSRRPITFSIITNPPYTYSLICNAVNGCASSIPNKISNILRSLNFVFATLFHLLHNYIIAETENPHQ